MGLVHATYGHQLRNNLTKFEGVGQLVGKIGRQNFWID